MTEERFTGSPDLWLTSLPSDRGPEGNVELWADAEAILDGLCDLFDGPRKGLETEGAHVALVDAYNRCVEERRRCEDLLKLHKAWESRRVGGVVEPESPVKG
jgi:hypothetical protein